MRSTTFRNVFLALAVIAATACGQKRNTVVAEAEQAAAPRAAVVDKDSTVYGLCATGTQGDQLRFVTDLGVSIKLSVAAARQENKLLGGLRVGDRLAVVMNDDSTVARSVVNVSTLMGDWVQISPLDGASEVGFRVKEGGIAESIEQSDIIYRTWRVFSNRLELVWQREGGGSADEKMEYTLLYLTDDSLSIRDNEDAYEYTRPHEVEDMGVEASDFGDYDF